MRVARGRLFQKAGALLGVGLLAATFLLGTASAADFNLTASPLPINLNVKPGGTVTTPLRVQNTGTEAITINVSLKKFGPTDKTGKPTIIDVGPKDDFIHWVHFSQTSFLAQPNVWYTVTMTINPPADAAFGYYYAVIFSQASNGQKITTDKLHSTVHGAVASLVLLDVNVPGEKRTLTVTSFVSAHKVYEYLPSIFTITVHNSGNVHAVPAGDIFISKNHKDTLDALPINNGAGNVLPKTDRQFEVSWNDGFPSFQPRKVNDQVISDKNGKPAKGLSWNGLNFSKFRFGKYYAHLYLTYNDGQRDVPVEGDLSFWVIPWKIMLLTFVILGLVFWGLFHALRNVFRRPGARKKKA